MASESQASELAPAAAAPTGSWAPPRERARSLETARAAAVRDTWRALWVSRLLVWIAGVVAVAVFGVGRARSAFDPPHLTSGFGWLGDLLAAPAARWDAAWYLVIAHYGYRPDLGVFTAPRAAFFPLYPLALRGVSGLGVQPVLAGVLLSTAALAIALYGVHRLTALELKSLLGRDTPGLTTGREVARLAVLLTALAPMAYYLSAVYSESLYLALSVGVFWSARQGRWAWVGVLGALAGATRSTGLLLALPAMLLYLYGPREDRSADFPRVGEPGPRNALSAARAQRRLLARVRAGRPRYRLRRDVLWLGLMPVGVGVYMTYLALAGGDALLPFHAQEVWNRHFAGPYVGVWDGARAAFDGLRQLLSFQSHTIYFKLAGGSPLVDAGHNVMLFGFLAAALPALIGVLRRLPFAYGAYVLAALALALSYPVEAQPLMSLPRFLLVLFPLSMWLAAWLAVRPRARSAALVTSCVLLALFVAEFATWHWVA